jgi:hypothetical protein
MVAPADTPAPALTASKGVTVKANEDAVLAPQVLLAVTVKLPAVALHAKFTTILVVPVPEAIVRPVPLYAHV